MVQMPGRDLSCRDWESPGLEVSGPVGATWVGGGLGARRTPMLLATVDALLRGGSSVEGSERGGAHLILETRSSERGGER